MFPAAGIPLAVAPPPHVPPVAGVVVPPADPLGMVPAPANVTMLVAPAAVAPVDCPAIPPVAGPFPVPSGVIPVTPVP
jgi:hypothetical protein